MNSRPLTPEGEKIADDLARRHGFSVDAVTHMMFAVLNGNGSMAQFSHPEFGGSGQWMRGGMLMLGDMFNHGLKNRVGALCYDISAILANQPGLEFFSVHQHPAYPGTGTENVGRNCFNYPVSPLATRETYRATLRRALDDLRSYRPDLIAISAGFDAYDRDPLGGGPLKVEDFHWLGQTIRALNVPHFSLLEGGYSRDLPELILAYLKGLAGK